jgi:hypothetical protein
MGYPLEKFNHTGIEWQELKGDLRSGGASGLPAGARYVNARAKIVVLSQAAAANVKVVNPAEDYRGFRFAQCAAATSALTRRGGGCSCSAGREGARFQVKASGGKQGTESDSANSGAQDGLVIPLRNCSGDERDSQQYQEGTADHRRSSEFLAHQDTLFEK